MKNVSVPMAPELIASLQLEAERLQRPVAFVVRLAVQAWLIKRDVNQDMSAEDVGLGPPLEVEGSGDDMAVPSPGRVMRVPVAPKAERLVAARAALNGVPARRGFASRELPSGKVLEVRVPGESYVDPND